MDTFDDFVTSILVETSRTRAEREHAEHVRRLAVVADILREHAPLLTEYGYNAPELADYITGDYYNAGYGVTVEMRNWVDRFARRAERMAGISGNARRGGLHIVVDGSKRNTDGGNLYAIAVSIGLVLDGSEPIPVRYL